MICFSLAIKINYDNHKKKLNDLSAKVNNKMKKGDDFEDFDQITKEIEEISENLQQDLDDINALLSKIKESKANICTRRNVASASMGVSLLTGLVGVAVLILGGQD